MRPVPDEPVRLGGPAPRLPDPGIPLDPAAWHEAFAKAKPVWLGPEPVPTLEPLVTELRGGRSRVEAVRDWLLCANLAASLVLLVACTVVVLRGR